MSFFVTSPTPEIHQLIGIKNMGNIPGCTSVNISSTASLGGIDLRDMTDLESLSIAYMVTLDEFNTQSGGVRIENCPALSTIGIGGTTKIGGSLEITDCPSLFNLSLVELTDVDSLFVGGGTAPMAALESLTFNGLLHANLFRIGNAPVLTSISAPFLTTLETIYLVAEEIPSLAAIDFPSLTTITNNNLDWYNSDSIVLISLPALETIGDFFIQNMSVLEMIDLGDATAAGNLTFWNCPVLNNLTATSLVTCTSLTFIDSNNLASLNFPALITLELYDISYSSASLQSVVFPLLTAVSGNVMLFNNPNCTSIDLSSVVTVGGNIFIGVAEGGGPPNDGSLTSLDLSSLQSCDWIQIQQCEALLTLDLGAFTTCNSLNISNNAALTSVTFTSFIPTDGQQVVLMDNALDAATINQILARLVANAGYVSGAVNLTGGTNSAPIGQGLTDVATLTGRGVSVLTN